MAGEESPSPECIAVSAGIRTPSSGTVSDESAARRMSSGSKSVTLGD
jgi:hypothetical protein